MKVLFLLNMDFTSQGPSNHLFEGILKKSLEDGNIVHLIKKSIKNKNPNTPEEILKNKNISADSIKIDETEKTNFIARYLVDLIYAFKCVKYYRKKKEFDVVFLQSCNTAFFHIALLKFFLKKPILYNVQDIFPDNTSTIGVLKKSNIIYKILYFMQNQAYKNADRIITISEDMKKTLIEKKISADKIEVVHNWSYSDNFINIKDTENKFLKKYGISNNQFKVVYAGKIGALQNVEIIVKAANKLKDNKKIDFYIIGDGIKKSEIISYVNDNNLKNIKFFPLHPSEYATHIYSMADINIIPLKKGVIKTALPSKTATCLICEKPIIACVDVDSKYSKMIASCEKCYSVDSNDVSELAKCIENNFNNGVGGRSKDLRKLFEDIFLQEVNIKKYIDCMKKM